jgi:tetratricopeptide (TPR) repeat protein
MKPVFLACRGALIAFILTAIASSAAAQGNRVVGIVKDETGQPIKGATLSLENPDAIPRNFTATSDDRGRFAIIGLKSGEWSIVAQAPGFIADAGRVVVRAAMPATPTFTLRRAPQAAPSALGNIGAKELQAELRSADQQYNAQQWDQAIVSYKSILTRAPALSYVNLQIGSAYRRKKDYDGALAAYNDMLKADPSSDRARVGLGLTYMEKGDLTAAEAALSPAAQTPAASKELLCSLGEVEAARGNNAEAMKWFQKASATDPNWGKPLLQMGLVAMKTGDRTNAAAMMQKVVTVDPASAEATQAKTIIEQLR